MFKFKFGRDFFVPITVLNINVYLNISSNSEIEFEHFFKSQNCPIPIRGFELLGTIQRNMHHIWISLHVTRLIGGLGIFFLGLCLCLSCLSSWYDICCPTFVTLLACFVYVRSKLSLISPGNPLGLHLCDEAEVVHEPVALDLFASPVLHAARCFACERSCPRADPRTAFHTVVAPLFKPGRTKLLKHIIFNSLLQNFSGYS